MFAGYFIPTKYESLPGGIYKIQLQEETIELVIDAVPNSPPIGAVDQEVRANARGGKRQIGVTARTVTVKFTGATPTDYLGTPLTIPVLDPTVWAGYISPPGKTGTYLDSPVEVIGSSPERIR